MRRRRPSRWRDILQTLVCYRLIDPGSEWRLGWGYGERAGQHEPGRREPGLILGPGGGAIVPPVSNSAVKVINRRCVTLEAPPWAISCSR